MVYWSDVITRARSTFRIPFTKIALALAVVAILLLLAAVLAQGNLRITAAAGLLLSAPALLYLTVRWPIVFPFGLYLALVPFDPLLSFSGGLGTLTKFIGIAAILALLLRAILTRRMLLPPSSWYAWGALLLWMTLTAMWSITAETTLAFLQTMGSLFALLTAIAIYPITALEFRVLRRLTIFAGIVTAAYGFYAYRSGQHVFSTPHGLTRLVLQAGKLQFDPNHYAAFFLIPIAFVVAGFLVDTRLPQRILYACGAAMLVANILLSGSRGGLIAVAVIVVYAGIRTRRYFATAVTGAAGLALSVAIPNVWARFFDPTQGDGSGRREIWATGFRALHDYWAFGAGFATYPDVYDRYLLATAQKSFQGWGRPGHNLLMQSSVELGVLGVILVLVAWWSSFRQTASIPRDHPLYASRIGCEAAIAGLFWMAMTIDILWYKYLWIALSLCVLLANLYRPRLIFAPGMRPAEHLR